jgi:protein-glutamine gamma-glutamyltransferase
VIITEKLPFGHLLSISLCLASVLVAHVTTLPPWVTVTIVVCGSIRLAVAYRGHGAPPKAILFIVAALAIVILFLRFRTFNGLAAGNALLALMAGLKLLETQTKRDIYIITLIIYFLGLSALLYSESFWLLAYLIGVGWFTTTTLLRITTTEPAPSWRASVLYSGRLLAQALPLALVFWMLFPRFGSPLWNLGSESGSAESGLSDTMSPGDITELAQSDDIAFRVHFKTKAPPQLEQYWRGPVLHDFDGRTWRHSYPVFGRGPPPLEPRGPAYQYTVNLEPHQHPWIFTLDWASKWDLAPGALTGDYTLVQADPVSRPIDVTATSYTHVQSAEPLTREARRRDTALPPQRNPRALQLARELRAAHTDDMELVSDMLQRFSQQAFYYTLSPPRLGQDSVDEFLFDSKRGFCGHYASAFATIMRGAGIPARVVTGYQGGTFNRFADYWIIRQNSAHAWVEVWMNGHGWVRIDPTSAIDPSRVEQSVNDAVSADEPLSNRWQRRRPWLTDALLRFDTLRELWREQILTFNQDSQERLLQMLRIPEPDGQRLVMVLAAALGLVFIWLTWQIRRELEPGSKNLAVRAYVRLCAKLAAAGITRMPYEGAEAYAARVAQARPDLGDAVISLCRHYSTLRYAPASDTSTLGQFEAAVRAFHPKPAAK